MSEDHTCYVHLQMPNSVEVVVCGRYSRAKDASGVVRGRFVYEPRYLARPDAVPLDPANVRLTTSIFETTALSGLPGALRDALPDAWGRTTIRRTLGQEEDPDEGYLLINSPGDRAGALSFSAEPGPIAKDRQYRPNAVSELEELLRVTRLIESGASALDIEQGTPSSIEARTSIGGARPKNTVEDERGLYVAKFPSKGDQWNNAAVGGAMLRLAAQCEIQVPEFRIERVGGDNVLLIDRFDRVRTREGGYLRHRMASALTVLTLDDSPTDRQRWSYLLLADALERWSSHPLEDKRELFRRMVFNALISNSDDHPRNHAVLASGRGWRLSPAYDMTPDPQPGVTERRLALDCGLHGRIACRANLLSAASRFGVMGDEATAIIDRTADIIRANWRSEIVSLGGTAEDCERVAAAFVHEGFEYPAI